MPNPNGLRCLCLLLHCVLQLQQSCCRHSFSLRRKEALEHAQPLPHCGGGGACRVSMLGQLLQFSLELHARVEE